MIMRTRNLIALLTVSFLCAAAAGVARAETAGLARGTPKILSMSALTFGPDGILFIGDGKGGVIHAVDTGDRTPRGKTDEFELSDIEGKIAARLGTSPAEIMIHDMAVNPLSQNVYMAVSRGRGKWDLRWKLPNHVTDAVILVKLAVEGKGIDVVPLENVPYARKEIPNPVDAAKMHAWMKEVSLRTETITDLVWSGGVLYVAGLSNEEFAATLWTMPFPFSDVAATTLEIYHGAHGAFETAAPIQAFLPYELNGEKQILAAYLCTPLVTFKMSDFKNGAHLKGRTVGEFGAGNYPLDMLTYKKDGKEKLLIANSNLPFMIVDPADIASYKGSITSEVKGYLAGVKWEPRSGTGILQMDALNDKFILALQRLPSGMVDVVSFDIRWF